MKLRLSSPKKIFSYQKNNWSASHVTLPAPILLKEQKIIRVFYSSLNSEFQGHSSFFDLDLFDPFTVKYIHDAPVLSPGAPGDFDDNGVICTDVKFYNNQYHMLYAGFELCDKIRYRIMTGLALSDDGINFRRNSRSPLLDRCDGQEFFRCGPSYISENKIIYVGGGEWFKGSDKDKPIYDIYITEKNKNKKWTEGTLIRKHSIQNDQHGFGRPSLCYFKDFYFLTYSVRSIKNKSYVIKLEIIDENYKKKEEIPLTTVYEESGENDLSYSTLLTTGDRLFILFNGVNFGENDIYISEINLS